MSKHLSGWMFDLETAGQSPTCAIMSCGVCYFDIDTRTISDEFYIVVNLKESLEAGNTYDKSTLDWWQKQKPEILESALKNSEQYLVAMQAIWDHFNKRPKAPVWAWGSHFDVPILEMNFRNAGINKTPWKYWNVRDARTIEGVFLEKIIRSGAHHNSLEDAKEQAEYLINLFNPVDTSDE